MTSPLLYEINTRCWLRALSEQSGRAVTLADVPEAEFDGWRDWGFSHLWLMGVWTTGPRSQSHSLHNPHLRKRYSEILPHWHEDDVPGSPYAIANYEVPAALGGNDGLANFRERLNGQGIKLILDFVPNHVGLDHPWVEAWPELFVRSAQKHPDFFEQQSMHGTHWLAHGKDPYFPSWTDTVQLDYRLPATHTAMLQVLKSVANRCDGVRCDMAMLVLNEIFRKTWAPFPADDPQTKSESGQPDGSEEFWAGAISAITTQHRDFLFLAEAYWGLEPRLQALGFDYTYDKIIYDHLVGRRPADLQRHLLAARPEYLAAGIHFLENHDEQRIAGCLSLEEHRAAALLTLGLPGMRMLHEGQLTGATIHTPVHLGRQPIEPVDEAVRTWYERLLVLLKNSAIGQGKFQLLRPEPAWAGNPTAQNFVVVQWQCRPGEVEIVIVNLAAHRGQCRIRLELAEMGQGTCELHDRLTGESCRRQFRELRDAGLVLDVAAWGGQVLWIVSAG